MAERALSLKENLSILMSRNVSLQNICFNEDEWKKIEVSVYSYL
jgi:hypothetical protein